MKIHINELTFEAIVGVLDFERQKAQKVIVDFECSYNYTEEYLDYSKIVNFIKNDIVNSRYEVLEEACISLSRKLRENFKEIENLKMKITKPDIISSAKVGVEWSE